MEFGGDLGSAAEGSAIDLEVAGSGPVSCCFSIPSSFFTMCCSLPCLSSAGEFSGVGALP